MKLFEKTITLLLLVSLLFSCNVTEDDVEPDKTLTGKWTITNTKFLGLNIPGDGSYLSFSDCEGASCSGVDYKASDQSSSTFTYVLDNEESIKIIDNDSSKGGSYSGTWTIQEYTTSKLILKIGTIFGDQVITFEKEDM
jgi:hypothetical protein